MRDLTPAVQGQLSASQHRMAHIFALYLDADVVRLTDDVTDVVIGESIYYATGHALDFQHDGDGDGLQINTLTVTVSGVEQSVLSASLRSSFINRRIVLWRVFFDEMGNPLQPLLLFDGRCDGPAIDDDLTASTSVIQVRASNQFVDFERVRGRLTNHERQQQFFPGDRGFEFVSQLATGKELQWGGK